MVNHRIGWEKFNRKAKQFDGKNHGKNHGFPVDFPLNQSSEMGASHGHHDWMRTGGSCITLERS
jgi:hypothetical protein